MRKIVGVLLGLIMILLLSCGGGDQRYDTNDAVPKGDPPFPPLGHYWVIDQANVLSLETITKGDAICQKLKEDSLAEVVVLTINGVKNEKDYATHYGRWLGLGRKGFSTEGGNNGVVWLIRPDAQDRITVSVGRGLPLFTTVDYGKILDAAIDYVNFGSFDAGVMELVKGTDSTLRVIHSKIKKQKKL